MTQHIRTNKEQLPILPIDNVSGIVYSTDQLSRPQQGRQVGYAKYLSEYGCTPKPHSHSAVNYLFQKWLIGNLIPYAMVSKEYAKGRKGAQSGQVVYADSKCSYANVRKQIINNIKLRKCYALKEKQYGKKLNG